jgi:hypothetical protein
VLVTIEDATGVANLIVWPEILGRSRRAASASPIALHRIGRELTKPNLRFAAKPASPLDRALPVEDMRTAVVPGDLLSAVRRWDCGRDPSR